MHESTSFKLRDNKYMYAISIDYKLPNSKSSRDIGNCSFSIPTFSICVSWFKSSIARNVFPMKGTSIQHSTDVQELCNWQVNGLAVRSGRVTFSGQSETGNNIQLNKRCSMHISLILKFYKVFFFFYTCITPLFKYKIILYSTFEIVIGCKLTFN